jgi:hypothetical protein
MKKKIILIDLELSLIQSIYESKKVQVEYLITEADNEKLKAIKKRFKISNIISRANFHEYTVQENRKIDYELIDKFKHSQLDSEHYQDRLSDDVNLKQYLYINALSFWIEIFSKKDISAVILDGLMHGANYDSLALDVAKFYNVPGYVITYHMERITKNGINAVRSILNYNVKKDIKLNCNKLNLTQVDMRNYLFSPIQILSEIKKQRNFKDYIKLLLPSHTPTIFYIVSHLIRLKPIIHHGLKINRIKVLMNIFYIWKLKKFYNSIACGFDKSKKSIFYALHFDPEASIMAKARFSNQLMIIKQLSQNLPDDWTLYVKEHPNQFELHQPGWWFYLTSIHKYRTKDFYNQILKLKNVKLLKYDIKSKDIIQNVRGISTINGTLASEALSLNIPLLLFGHQSTPFGKCKDVFKITTSDSCFNALKIIEGGFVADYSDFVTIVNYYCFELKRATQNDVQLLVDYLVCEYNTA